MPESDAALRDILAKVQTIAVVGIKDAETEDAFRVPRYLQEAGCRIIPVNPKFDRVLGEPAVARIADLPDPVDLIDLFRAPEHIPAHVDEILALPHKPTAVWMQLGIQHGESAARLRAVGIRVVQDRCIMVEHRRLLGDTGDE
jgi:predicted CoA-binding protein